MFGIRKKEEEPNISDRLPEDPVLNGIHAEQLLHDPLLKQCFNDVRNHYLKNFESATLGDVEQLQLIQLSLAALKDVRAALLAYRFNGQTALGIERKANMPQRSRPLRSQQ